jgi:hypothetical protein
MTKEETMFDLDQFVADCRDALAVDKSHKVVREVVCRAVANPGGILKALGEPTRGAIKTLYRSDDLTILNVIWAVHDIDAPQSQHVGGDRNLHWPRR